MFQVKATRFRDWVVLVLAGMGTIALLLLPLPGVSGRQHWSALFSELENLGHPLAFGMLAHLSFRLLRSRLPAPARLPYVLVLLAAAVFGLASEVLQRYVGRDAEWIDVFGDVLGASFVLLLHARREHPGSRLPATAAAVVVLIATAPLFWTVAAYAYRTAQAPLLWRADARLFQRFSQVKSGTYPGLVIEEPLPDWSGYRTLVIHVRNLHDVTAPIVVRVHDRRHNQESEDRYNQSFELAADAHETLRIPLEGIRQAPHGRQMDLTAIRGVVVFQTAANVPLSFAVSEIRLER